MNSRQQAYEKYKPHLVALEKASKKVAEIMVECGATFSEVDSVLQNAKHYLAIHRRETDVQNERE